MFSCTRFRSAKRKGERAYGWAEGPTNGQNREGRSDGRATASIHILSNHIDSHSEQ